MQTVIYVTENTLISKAEFKIPSRYALNVQ